MDPDIDDPGAWSGSDDPEGPYCSQDEDYNKESNSNTELQNNQESLFCALEPNPEGTPEQHNPELLSSYFFQENDGQDLISHSPEPCIVARSGEQNGSFAEDQDTEGSPGSGSEYSAHNQGHHQPSCSGSEYSAHNQEHHQPSGSCSEYSAHNQEHHQPSCSCSEYGAHNQEQHQPSGSCSEYSAHNQEHHQPSGSCSEYSAHNREHHQTFGSGSEYSAHNQEYHLPSGSCSEYSAHNQEHHQPSGSGSEYSAHNQEHHQPSGSCSEYSAHNQEHHQPSGSGSEYSAHNQEHHQPSGSGSEYSAHNQEHHQPSGSGSSLASTPPDPRKQLAHERLDYVESEDKGKQGIAAGGGGDGRQERGGGIEGAPPASYVSDGIQAQSAEQAEQWGTASLTETTRASRQRARYTCLRRSEGLSERHLKEAKSKCKRIAQLLTAAPNPESRGVLMFKKRRQRARKFTLVSYGTGEPTDVSFKDKYEFEEGSASKDFRYSLQATSDSELDEDYSFYVHGQEALTIFYEHDTQDQGLSPSYNWDRMEQLPQTKGKGVMMFAQRRQRIDEITAQHEEMRQKGIPVEAFVETETPAPSKPAFQREESAPVQQAVQSRQQLQYQEQQYQQQMFQPLNTGINGVDPYQMSAASKSLVSNRTAKPFLGSLNQCPTTYSPVKSVPSPIPKKPDNIFKVPVPVNTSPQVWSPTGDIIASRDERIAVPAIKSGILPEAKKRGANKTRDVPPEEDYLSLGAEACNFMQAPSVRQKKPPPVLPKPAINPACPPWSSEGHASRSPLPATSPPAAQQNWAPSHPQPPTKPWAPSPTQPVPQQHMSGWVPPNPSASYQPTWPSEPQKTPVSIKTPTTPHATPSQSKVPWTKSQTDANSVSSCPPQRGSSYLHASKAPPTSPRGHASETGLSDGPAFKGKGAELFARRQSRMEKFVVDAETVQANRARPPSPTLSMPSTWKYSPNIRAPPPASYNPIVSPFYPLAAQKQPPSESSPSAKSKENQGKPKAAPKHLSVVDVMKHQPYQLDTSLFTYNSTPDVKSTSPKASPVPPPESKRTPSHTPSHLQATVSGRFPSPTMSPSPAPSSASTQSLKQGTKPGGPVYSRSRSMSLPRRLSSVSTLSPVSSPGFYPTRAPLERHMSWAEPIQKPLSPWDAAVRSPLGLVDEAFGPQNVQQAISTSVHSAAHRKSLPEPPPEWKRRVSNDPIFPPQATPPTLSITLPARPSAPDPEKLIVYGPPFRPAQPLTIGISYTGSSSLPRNFTLRSGSVPAHRVSWRM